MHEELKGKLAEWVWGKDNIEVYQDGLIIYYHTTWNIRDEEWNIELVPDFTSSLDACFKLLKPAVISKGKAGILTWRQVLTDWKKAMAVEKAMDDAPALALCLVIEKLVDKLGYERR